MMMMMINMCATLQLEEGPNIFKASSETQLGEVTHSFYFTTCVGLVKTFFIKDYWNWWNFYKLDLYQDHISE